MLIGRVVRTIQVESLSEEISATFPRSETGATPGAGADGNGAGVIRDRLGAVVGHRVWGNVLTFKPDMDTLRASILLRSLNGTIWAPREPIEAKCALCSGVPHDDCSCGIYALKTPGMPFPTIGTGVTGEVYLWGKVIECDLGYRAQFAYPKKLTVVGDERMAKALAEAYGVEVIYIPDIPDIPAFPALAPILPQANLQPFALQPLPYSTSTPETVARALAAVLGQKRSVDLQAVGAEAINQAVKAVASARGYVMELGAADLS